MAAVRASSWETEAYWTSRIESYLLGLHDPAHALAPRAAFVALDDDGTMIGFVAGHLTTRYGCDGELQWIDTISNRRKTGVGTALVHEMAAWFVAQNASRVCIDVDPQNHIARNFYKKLGATELNQHWLVWESIQDVLERGDRAGKAETAIDREA